MTTDKNIYTLKEFLPEENFEYNELNGTALNKIYKAYFEQDCNIPSDYNSNCFSDDSENLLPSTLWELYKKFERNIKLIEEEELFTDLENDNKKLCFYLKYWIYDQFINENITNDEYSNFINLWNDQKKAKCPRCKCEFTISSIYHVKHLKRAYDYYLFLNAYKDTKTMSNNVADKNYCEYIGDAKAVYLSLESICKNSNASHCKEFRNSNLPSIEEDDNSSIICKTELTFDPQLEGDSQGVKMPGHKLHLDRTEERGPNVEGEGTTLTTGIERESAGAKPGSAPGEKPQKILKSESEEELPPSGPILHPQKEDEGSHPYFSGGLPEGGGDKATSLLGTNSEGNGSPIKTITSASMVGIPSIIFLLYKFTPIRTWIDPRIRKTKNELRSGVNESNELQSLDYNFDPTTMDVNRYNIGYQTG